MLKTLKTLLSTALLLLTTGISIFGATILMTVGLSNAYALNTTIEALWVFIVILMGVVSPLGLIMGIMGRITDTVSNVLYYIPLIAVAVLTSPLFVPSVVPYVIALAIVVISMICTTIVGFIEVRRQYESVDYILECDMRHPDE